MRDPQIRQTLWAGKALEEYAKQQARHYGLLYGGALGLLLVAAHWVLRNYRRSSRDCCRQAWSGESSSLYQPIVDSRSRKVGRFRGAAALAAGRELVPPGTFIDYAEEQGLILPMTGSNCWSGSSRTCPGWSRRSGQGQT